MRNFMRHTWILLSLGATLHGFYGCDSTSRPRENNEDAESIKYYIEVAYTEMLYCFLGLADGDWEWSWTYQSPDSQVTRGTALLHLSGCSGHWILNDHTDPSRLGDGGQLTLSPSDPHLWHELHALWPSPMGTICLPLPRQMVDSAYYADLLHLLQELTTPRFGQQVIHWPQHPVPVRAGNAVSGDVDLAACLHDAVAIWNDGEPDSLFRWQPTAGWGVRLIHFPDLNLSPPLSTQMVRLDETGRPLRLHILAGNNYDGVIDRPYAVRGMVHELGHALLLWGHSLDRRHVLWGQAPPMLAAPSRDERRAARLWFLLPAGLDLSAYGRSTEMDPER